MHDPSPATHTATSVLTAQWFALLLIAHIFHLDARGETETVAVTGMGAPAATGVVNGLFDTFAGTPVLNANGIAAFLFRLAIGNFTAEPGSVLQLEINGTEAGLFDQLAVNGIVNLSGIILLCRGGSVFQTCRLDGEGNHVCKRLARTQTQLRT